MINVKPLAILLCHATSAMKMTLQGSFTIEAMVKPHFKRISVFLAPTKFSTAKKVFTVSNWQGVYWSGKVGKNMSGDLFSQEKVGKRLNVSISFDSVKKISIFAIVCGAEMLCSVHDYRSSPVIVLNYRSSIFSTRGHRYAPVSVHCYLSALVLLYY